MTASGTTAAMSGSARSFAASAAAWPGAAVTTDRWAPTDELRADATSGSDRFGLWSLFQKTISRPPGAEASDARTETARSGARAAATPADDIPASSAATTSATKTGGRSGRVRNDTETPRWTDECDDDSGPDSPDQWLSRQGNRPRQSRANVGEYGKAGPNGPAFDRGVRARRRSIKGGSCRSDRRSLKAKSRPAKRDPAGREREQPRQHQHGSDHASVTDQGGHYPGHSDDQDCD